MIARIVTTLIGLVLFIYGILAFLTPLPIGAPLAVIGFFMIAAANPALRPVIRWMRSRWRWFDKLVRFAAPRASKSVKEVIEETEPGEQDQAETPEPQNEDGAQAK